MNQEIQDKIHGFFDGRSIREYRKGQIIIHGGEEPAGVSLLIDGVVEQYDITPEGNRVTVNIFKPGAFFPMSWAINKTPNEYFYGALRDVRLKQAAADEAVAFLRANPDVMFDLLSRVYRGTDALLRRLVITTNGIAAKRLIFELLIEAFRFGEELDDSERRITAKQSTLAAHSGLARETVSRELHKLEDEKLISRQAGGIILHVRELEKRLDTAL
jgi:CRP-like cAMP-binding protein